MGLICGMVLIYHIFKNKNKIMGIFGLGKKNKTTIVEGVVNLVTGVRGMIDDKNFTSEEKARFDSKTADASADFVKETLSENTERSKARRSVAIDTVRFYFALVIFLIISWKFDPLWFDAVKNLTIEFKLPMAFIMIMAFFFGGHYINKIWGGSKPKQQ